MVKMDFEEMFLDQPPITIEQIQGMLTSPRRRVLTEEWQALNEPKDADKDCVKVGDVHETMNQNKCFDCRDL
jgi:hypothetical protein